MLWARLGLVLAGILVLVLLAMGLGDERSALDRIGQSALRSARRWVERDRDAKSVRADPILDAAFKGDLAAVHRLLDADPKTAREHVRSRDIAGMTALHRAVWGGHPDIVRLLLERGAEVDAKGGGGQTPLSLAARWGRGDLVDLLLEHGADASTKDDLGRTLLHYAAQYGHVDVMRALLAHGFDVNVQATTGTPLHSAAFRREIEAARFLLDHGANPDRRGYLGWTPLHVAASQHHVEAVRALLAAGADRSALTRSSETPLKLAWGTGADSVRLLLAGPGGGPR
jgi:ankyrin repeat protein